MYQLTMPNRRSTGALRAGILIDQPDAGQPAAAMRHSERRPHLFGARRPAGRTHPQKTSGCDISSALVSSCDCGARMKGGAVMRERSMPPMAFFTNERNDDFSLSGTNPVGTLDSSMTCT